MAARFHESGIQFLYPENWTLEKQETDSGWSVSVQSPETAFLLVSLDVETPSLESVIETAMTALREVYSDLEFDECIDSLAGQPAVGTEVRFISLDLTNTCWMRSLYCSEGTLLVMWQMNDLELERTEPVLRAICTSLRFEVD